jgi:hypothetical protein
LVSVPLITTERSAITEISPPRPIALVVALISAPPDMESLLAWTSIVEPSPVA